MAGMIKVALAIPNTPWVPERIDSLLRVQRQLQGTPFPHSKVFNEKAPCWKWSKDLWTWGRDTGCDYLWQVQDDVVLADNHWAILQAMLAAVPNQIIGLQGAHPKFRKIAEAEIRWARSQWLVGVSWIVPKAILRELVEFREENEELARRVPEDDFMGIFCTETKRHVWHPIPTIIDHDLTIKSTYANDHHRHRRPTVTWREFGPELEDPKFWKPIEMVPFVSNPHLEACILCESEPAWAGFRETNSMVGKRCMQLLFETIVKRA